MSLVGRFPALRHRNFRRYAVGQACSLCGFWMQSVAQSWLVYRLSDSAFVLGVVACASFLPFLVVSPLAGVIADHVPKPRIIRVTQILSLVLACAMGGIVALGWATVPIVAAVALAVGIVGAVDLPTRQAFIVEMVGAEDVPAAVAFNASVFNTARVVGPALAGQLLAVVGEAPCFFLNGASYLGLLWALAGMDLPERPPEPRRAAGDRLRAGLRYVLERPPHRALLLGLGVVSGLALQANVLMPIVARRTFGRGSQEFGLLLTAFGAGALVSALRLASRRYDAAQHRRHLLGGAAGFGCGLLAVAVAPRYGAALAAQAAAGFFMIRYTATTNALLQVLSHERVRGRVMAFHTMMFAGVSPLGSLLLGALAEARGPTVALVVSGVAPLAVAAWLAVRLPAAAITPPGDG